MKKPFLHTRIKKQVISGLSTDEAAQALTALGAIVDSHDVDAMPFEITAEDYEIVGLIERWHGTESRIRFEGELSLAPFDQTLRGRLILLAIALVCLGSFFVVTPISAAILGSQQFFSYNLLSALVVAVLILIPIIRYLNRDPLAQRRWDAQQELARFDEALTKLAAEHPSI